MARVIDVKSTKELLDIFLEGSVARIKDLQKKKLSDLYLIQKDIEDQLKSKGKYKGQKLTPLQEGRLNIRLDEVNTVIGEKKSDSGINSESTEPLAFSAGASSEQSEGSEINPETITSSNASLGDKSFGSSKPGGFQSNNFAGATDAPAEGGAAGNTTQGVKLPSVKITSPINNQEVLSPITFKFNSANVSKVQFFADIGNDKFGKFGPEIDPNVTQQLQFPFNVTGKRKVKLEGLDTTGKTIATDIIDITVKAAVAVDAAIGDGGAGAGGGTGASESEMSGPGATGGSSGGSSGGPNLDGSDGATGAPEKKKGKGPTSDPDLNNTYAESKAPGDIPGADKGLDPKTIAADIKYAQSVSPFSVLKDALKYDLSRLRFIENENEVLNDPIAFITNQVWDYVAFNKNLIAFRYTNSVLKKLVKETSTLLGETLEEFNQTRLKQLKAKYPNVKKNPNAKLEDLGPALELLGYNRLTDGYFQEIFSKNVKKLIEKEFPNYDLSNLEIRNDPVTGQKNIDPYYVLFWSWIKHIFIQNVSIAEDVEQQDSPSKLKRFKIVTNSNNFVDISFALYYMEKAYKLSGVEGGEVTNITKKLDQFAIESTKDNYNISLKVFNYAKETKFYNKNNYTFKNNLPTLSLNSIVQIDNSAFFAQNDATLSPSEVKTISNTKKVKQCKNSPASKKETALRLFYKEGNDNILDKPAPATGLGCVTPTKSWQEANNILFDAASLYPTRLNFTLPYMNDVTIVGKDIVPKELDIHNLITKDPTFGNVEKTTANFKALATRILQDNFIKLDNTDYLIDGSILLNEAKTVVSSEKFLNSYNNPNLKGWGATIAIDKNTNYKYDPVVNPNFSEQYAPYIGAFNFAHRVTKTSLVDDTSKQDYFINTLADQTTKLPAEVDKGTPYNYNDQNIRVYDSQIKYGEGYEYALSSFISFSEIKYKYNSFESSFFVSGKKGIEIDIKKKVKELNEQAEGKSIDAQLNDPEIKKIASELAKLQDALFDASDFSQNFYYFDYELGPSEYVNTIQEIEFAKDTSSVSYIELPPTPLFMRVFPLRGVNDKILLNFDNYSFKKEVVKEKIPKKYWPNDGSWEKTRTYFINSFNALTKDQLDSFGITTEKPADDEMYFTRTAIDRIQLYYAEGKKPKDFLDMEKYLDPINIFEQGFTKELQLKPNTKYYFSAKAISSLDLESDYSQVYEVELVDADGAVFTTVNIVDLKEQSMKRQTELTLNNKFRIEPALLQQAPNPAKNSIGYLTPSVFSPTQETRTQFKIRLTSKKTGKKVDFNVIYRQGLVKGSGQTAGKLSLDRATKDNVLISYFSQEASEVEIPPTPEEALQTLIKKEEATAAFFDFATKPVCCAFEDKLPLLTSVKPTEQLTWEKTEINTESFYSDFDNKLAKIDDFVREGVSDNAPASLIVTSIKGIINTMQLYEKCYLCKRVAEYGDGLSILDTVEKQIGINEKDFLEEVEKVDDQQIPGPDPSVNIGDYFSILQLLNCKQFGFTSNYGGNFGATQNAPITGEAAVKCSTLVEKKTLS